MDRRRGGQMLAPMRLKASSRATLLMVGALGFAPAASAGTAGAALHIILTIADDCLIDVEALQRDPADPRAMACTAEALPLVSRQFEPRDTDAPVEVVTVSF